MTAFAEITLDDNVPLARPIAEEQQHGMNLWLLQSYPAWTQIFIVITYNLFTWHRGTALGISTSTHM
jgi:hypothetical protein